MSHSLNPPHAPQAGAIQGIIIALTAFLPIPAIVSLAPAVPTLIQHFAGVPYVETPGTADAHRARSGDRHRRALHRLAGG